MSYIEIPNVEGTAESRIKAIQAAKTAVAGGGPFTSTGAGATDLIRVATYIETGHDYLDTHPTGKRRPKITNVTVVAPVGMPPAALEHFLEHVKDGSFIEFLERMKQAEGVDVDDLIADLLKGDKPEEEPEKKDDDVPLPPFDE